MFFYHSLYISFPPRKQPRSGEQTPTHHSVSDPFPLTPLPSPLTRCSQLLPTTRQVEKLLAKHAGPGTTRWIGPTSGVELCSAEGDWEPGWKKAFDKAVGKGLAQQRRALEHQGGTECSKDFAKVQSVT